MKSHLACIALIVVFCSIKAVLGKNVSTTSIKLKPAVTISPTLSIKPSNKPSSQSSSKPIPTPHNSSELIPGQTSSPIATNTIFHNMTNNTITANSTVGPPPTMSLNSTMSRNNTVPAMNSTLFPNATIPIPSKPTQAPPHSSRHIPTKPTASPGKDDKDYDSMKKRMWIAAAFAILFGLTTVILVYLVYRQRKINRDLEGDPATSRLL